MDYAEAIKALNDYFEGKDMKRGDALRIAELISRAEKAEKIVDEYAESARAIALWLSGFCNKELSYPSMISDAARKISIAYADMENRAKKAEKERDAAISEWETIMAYGDGTLDTCRFCNNSQCYERGGTKPCLPKWRGQKEE